MALKLDMWHLVLRLYQDCSNSDIRLALIFLREVEHGKMLESKSSWKALKIFAQECSIGDLGLTLTFYGKVKFVFWAFIWAEFMELAEKILVQKLIFTFLVSLLKNPIANRLKVMNLYMQLTFQ